jgi:hypothetical protein
MSAPAALLDLGAITVLLISGTAASCSPPAGWPARTYSIHRLSPGAGACCFDYNKDGLLDIYFVTVTWTRGVSSNEGRDLRGGRVVTLPRSAAR